MRISQNAAARPYADTLVKTASAVSQVAEESVGGALKHLGSTLMDNAHVLLPLASMTATGIATIADRMTAATRKAKVYKSMMEANPHLHDHDAEKVQKYFNVLYTTNPDFAKEPTIAGSFVMNQIGIGGNPSMPHAGIFEAALKARGGGPGGAPQRGAPMGSMLGDLSKIVSAKKDQSTLLAEKAREMKVQSRMYSMAKSRERSANTKLDQMQHSMQGLSAEAARFQELLDSHGIQYY